MINRPNTELVQEAVLPSQGAQHPRPDVHLGTSFGLPFSHRERNWRDYSIRNELCLVPLPELIPVRRVLSTSVCQAAT